MVINFFASWCDPCQQEGPELVKFQYEHQRSGDASMLSVVFDDSPSSARAYQATLGATWPTLADPGDARPLPSGCGRRRRPSWWPPTGGWWPSSVAPVTAADLDHILARAEASHA